MHAQELNEPTSQFLWAASKLLGKISSKNQVNNDLDTITVALRARKFSFLDRQKDKQYLCPRCNNLWNEGRYSLRLRSIKISKRLKKNINSSSASVKSHFKRGKLESLKLKQDNVMVFHCHICQNVVKSFITKPQFNSVSTIVTKGNSEKNSDTKKKKKKRKDSLAGLKIPNFVKKTKKNQKGFSVIP